MAVLAVCFFTTGCEYLEKHIILQKVAFEVDPYANRGEPFVCHIVISYYDDLNNRLKSMDAQSYFTELEELKKKYKDSLEIFSYDIIPGKNKPSKAIEPRSRSKAKGAYIFARYSSQGKYAETVGRYPKLLVHMKQDRMICRYDLDTSEWKKYKEKADDYNYNIFKSRKCGESKNGK